MTASNPSRRTGRLVVGLVATLAVLWTAGVVLAPWLASQGWVLGGLLRLVYRPGCHQIAERCLDLGFGPMAVCSRCFGLYLGACLGLLWMWVRGRPCRLRPRWLAVVAIPTFIDFAAGQIGLPSLGNGARMIVALPLGLVGALFLGNGLIEIVRQNSTGSDRDSVG